MSWIPFQTGHHLVGALASCSSAGNVTICMVVRSVVRLSVALFDHKSMSF